jgi:transposase
MLHNDTSSGESVAEMKALVEALRTENKLLRQKIQLLLKRLFGSKTEVLNPAQLQLLMAGMEVEELSASGDDDPQSPSPSRGGSRKRRDSKPRIPENLPTEDVRLDPEEVKASPLAYKRIGEEVTREIDVIPPQYFCRRIIRGKYVRIDDKDAAPIIAPLPERLIEGSYASAGIVTEIVIKKYQDHIPLYRQEQILKERYGIEISRQTMVEWIRAAADWLSPLYRLIRKSIQESRYLQVDETPVTYCNKGSPGGSADGYFWVYHDPWKKDVLYEWHTGRGAQCLEKVLKDFKGTIQCDGYGAYTSYAKGNENIDIACCWAHARRKFHEAIDEAPAIAGWFLKQIQALYAIETDLRGRNAGPDERMRVRRCDSKWRLKLLHKALRSRMTKHLPQSQMGKAVLYALARWAQLEKYSENGLLEIDNNGVENSIRPTAIGKKNWLFIGHPEAGDRSAILYTIIENCKRRGINPQEYMKDVLTRLPSMKMAQVKGLLPATWLAERTETVA